MLILENQTVVETPAGNVYGSLLTEIAENHNNKKHCCCVDVLKNEKGNKRILHQLHWGCPALHPVQSLCWTHYHLSARMGLRHIHWGEPKSPHVLHPPVYLFLWQRDLWSLLHSPAFYGAQVAQPETIQSKIRRHRGYFMSQCDHQISVNFSPIN